MRLVALIFLVVLSGCTEAIHLRNATTGQTATCGDHPLVFPIYATIAATHDGECVQDYKEQGFVRVAAPN